jgi:hypothetical protein
MTRIMARIMNGAAAKKANRCAENVTDQVAQGIVLRGLADAVTLAESFDMNDSPVHHLSMHLKVGPQYLLNYALKLCRSHSAFEIMPYAYPRRDGKNERGPGCRERGGKEVELGTTICEILRGLAEEIVVLYLKNAPLTTALPPLVRVTLILTWPEMFQTR